MVRNPTPQWRAHFAHLEDPRIERTKLHQLLDIVFIALCAVVSGANDFVGMAKFGRSKQEWLAKYLELPNGIPSDDTFRRVLSALDAEAFVGCFLSWVEDLQEATAGRVISIDGKTARQEADYVLAVKGNQEHLEEDILGAVAAVDDGTAAQQPKRCQAHDARHGRQETRICEALPVPEGLRQAEDWKDLRCICRVTRLYREREDEKSEVRYFISSLQPNAKVLAHAVREHWGVENGLPWVLDMYFGEDRSRARTDHAAANLAMIRRWVLTMLRQNQDVKGSMEKKRLQAAWNDETREQLLGIFIGN